MTASPPYFDIAESRIDGCVRLSLSGELDRTAAPRLESRLAPLRVSRARTRLDLSGLEFIDSSGIHLIVQTIGEARLKHWEIEIEPELSPQVMRVFRLVHLDRFVLKPAARRGTAANRRPARPGPAQASPP